MRRLGVGRDQVKIALSWSAEKVGRLKPNGRLLSYSRSAALRSWRCCRSASRKARPVAGAASGARR